MRPRVFYDHDVFSAQKFGGVSRYFSELIARMDSCGIDPIVFAGLHINCYLRFTTHVIGARVPALPFTGRFRRQLNDIWEHLFLSRETYQLVHKTFYSPSPVPPTARAVITVHDLIHERLFGQTHRTSVQKRKWIERADAIIAISMQTALDLTTIYNVPKSRITVIPHGCAALTPTPDYLSEVPPWPYILYVGQRSGYKNFNSLLIAYGTSPRLRGSMNLVCYGGAAFSGREQLLIRSLGVSGRVHQFGGDDVRLAAFYSKAKALVYPSVYEGFGLPVLEAMSVGCPVICSDRGSLPEVGGLAAIYFDPASPDGIRTCLEDTLFNDLLLKRYSELGLSRSTEFSWDRCAQDTATLYRSLAS